MKTLEVKITFTEGILGTSPKDEDIYKNFVLEKAKSKGAKIDETDEQEELEGLQVDEEMEKGMTGFQMDEDGNPYLLDYQIKGFFKGACQFLKMIDGTKSEKFTAYKKKIDGLIFPKPRKIYFHDVNMSVCQRPLRANTPQGERVALAMSDEIAAGAWIEVEIDCLKDDQVNLVREWLDYGKFSGIGQWRNSGKGRFTWEEIRCY